MKAKHFRWPFLTLLIAMIIALKLGGKGNIGLTVRESGGNFHIAGGVFPWPLALSLLLAGCYMSLMWSQGSPPGPPMLRIRLRYVAFCIDFFISVFMMGTIVGTLAILAEWKRTGEFQWQFERASYVPGDSMLDFVTWLVSIFFMLGYFTLPLVRKKPTPGSCLIGYQVLLEDGSAMTWTLAVQRTFFGITRSVLTLFWRQPRTFWLDEKYSTGAYKLR